MTAKTRKPPADVDPLAESAAAFAAARNAHAAAVQALAEAVERMRSTRADMTEEIVKAAKAGVPQRDIHRRTNDVWTRENIRKICIAAGIDLSRK